MDYFKIKKGTFIEIVVSALLGMIISLIAVLYLVNKIVTLNRVIDDLQNREPIIIVEQIEKKENEENVDEKKDVVQKKAEEKKDKVVEIHANYDDRELLARLLYCEGRGESVECQKAIMSVIVNRLNSGYWGNSFSDVVYAKGQFSPVSSGAINNAKPSETQYNIVDDILANGSVLPSWVMYFRASYHFSWSGYVPYRYIDNTYFGGYNK